MKKQIEAIILDWAGTAVDFGSMAPVQAFIEAFQKYNITPTIEEVRAPMGMLKWFHVEAMMKSPRINQLWQEKHGRKYTKDDIDMVYEASEKAIFEILHNYATPKPFVVDTINALRADGIKIGSTTGYTEDMMKIIVPKANEQGYFTDYLCTANTVGNQGRPYPYMIFKNLEALKIPSVYSAIKVGDTVSDILEGKNAGMLTVGIIDGSSIMSLSQKEFDKLCEEDKKEARKKTQEIYIKNGADYIIQDMSELVNLIKMLNS